MDVITLVTSVAELGPLHPDERMVLPVIFHSHDSLEQMPYNSPQ